MPLHHEPLRTLQVPINEALEPYLNVWKDLGVDMLLFCNRQSGGALLLETQVWFEDTDSKYGLDMSPLLQTKTILQMIPERIL
jgi:hypothetical protein